MGGRHPPTLPSRAHCFSKVTCWEYIQGHQGDVCLLQMGDIIPTDLRVLAHEAGRAALFPADVETEAQRGAEVPQLDWGGPWWSCESNSRLREKTEPEARGTLKVSRRGGQPPSHSPPSRVCNQACFTQAHCLPGPGGVGVWDPLPGTLTPLSFESSLLRQRCREQDPVPHP